MYGRAVLCDHEVWTFIVPYINILVGVVFVDKSTYTCTCIIYHYSLLRSETLSVSSSEGDEEMVDIGLQCKGPDVEHSFPAVELHEGREYSR